MHQRPRRRFRAAPGPAGYTLVEVVVAMLISCVMVTAVMGVAITAKQSTVHNARRLQTDQAISELSGLLKNFVTACGCNPSSGSCTGASPTACTMITGPNTANAGVATWYLNNYPGAAGLPIVDSLGNTYALKCGTHKLSNVLPAIEAAPFNGNISYTVSWPGGCPNLPGPTGTPTVAFNAYWTEP
jgi:prepilin-type N-terminal cleavage/methylation domain-containing protein